MNENILLGVQIGYEEKYRSRIVAVLFRDSTQILKFRIKLLGYNPHVTKSENLKIKYCCSVNGS